MNEKCKEFASKNIKFNIIEICKHIIIQIKKDLQIEAEKYYTYEDLYCLSNYFHLFTSIPEIVNELLLLAETNKISCIEKINSYDLIITINLKGINTINMTIPQYKVTSKEKEQDNAYKDLSMQSLNCRINKLENQINDSTDKIISELSKKMYLYINMIESKYEKQMKDVTTHMINAVIQNDGHNKEINNSNIMQTVSQRFNEIESKLNKQMKTLHKKVDSTIESIEEKAEFKYRSLSGDKSVKSNTSTDYQNHKLCSPFNSYKANINTLEFSEMKKSQQTTATVTPTTTYISPQKSLYEPIGYLTIEEKSLIMNWITQFRIKRFHLIYSSSYDQDNYEVCSKEFHSLNPLLILIESDIGKRFGGYTSVSWNNTGKIGKYFIIINKSFRTI